MIGWVLTAAGGIMIFTGFDFETGATTAMHQIHAAILITGGFVTVSVAQAIVAIDKLRKSAPAQQKDRSLSDLPGH